MRRREFTLAALGLPLIRGIVDATQIETVDKLREKYSLSNPQYHAILDYWLQHYQMDQLFHAEYDWLDQNARSPRQLMKLVPYYAKRFVEGINNTLLSDTLSALNNLERAAPSPEDVISVVKEIYQTPQAEGGNSWNEIEAGIRDTWGDLGEYIDGMRYGIEYDHQYHIPSRINQAYASESTDPKVKAAFEREVTRLREEANSRKPCVPTTRYPNFGLAGDAQQPGYLYPQGIMPIPSNYYEPEKTRWSTRIQQADMPVLSQIKR